MMKMLFTAAFLMASLLASGQEATPLIGKDTILPSAQFPEEWYPKGTVSSVSAPIAGAPYSAVMTMTTTLLDSEGKAHGSSSHKTLEWRDSAGRVRQEELFPEIPGQPNAFAGIPHPISVADPVHHCGFQWYAPSAREHDRTATVSCDSLEVSRSVNGLGLQMTNPMPGVVREQVGKMTTTTTLLAERIVHGLKAVGVRSVTTEVDGEGKLRDIKMSEIWWSPALYESLLTTVKTPSEIVVFELTDIRRDKPDARLFYPPEGYSIHKEAEVPPLPVPAKP